MKTYKISFIRNNWGSIAAEVVRKGNDESEVVSKIMSELSEDNKAKFTVKAQELLN